MKYKPVAVGDDGWSEWISPIMRGYKMRCCDCGLVHDMQFVVMRVTRYLGNDEWKGKRVPRMKVLMRARRNERATAQSRRHNPKDKD